MKTRRAVRTVPRLEILVEVRDDGRGRSGLSADEGAFTLIRVPAKPPGLAGIAAKTACRTIGLRVLSADPPVLVRVPGPRPRRLPLGPRGAEIGTIHAYPLDDD
ncbi:MAG: hypothetical protein ACFBSD_06860 [Paracoccaceae bacterium]